MQKPHKNALNFATLYNEGEKEFSISCKLQQVEGSRVVTKKAMRSLYEEPKGGCI